MIGRMKLPRTAGMTGMRKKKIITTPCSVKNLLYVSEVRRSPSGVSSSIRIIMAKKPPRTNMTETDIR